MFLLEWNHKWKWVKYMYRESMQNHTKQVELHFLSAVVHFYRFIYFIHLNKMIKQPRHIQNKIIKWFRQQQTNFDSTDTELSFCILSNLSLNHRFIYWYYLLWFLSSKFRFHFGYFLNTIALLHLIHSFIN